MLTETEDRSKADFKACPILRQYVATMLEDLQFSEADQACEEEREARDTGTIYTLCEGTYVQAKADCEAFYAVNKADIEMALDPRSREDEAGDKWFSEDEIGFYFYMIRVGHGVAFTDDDTAACLTRLNEAARAFGRLDAYLGDDGEVYT